MLHPSYSYRFLFHWLLQERMGRNKMISLCLKSYIIEDAEVNQKISCKGISKNQINPMEKFEKSIHNKINTVSTNIGFRIKNSSLYTYSQKGWVLIIFTVRDRYPHMEYVPNL